MTDTATSLVLSEVFGPTFQGEGPHTGRRVAFVRLGGCNLSCSWCDTPYTWDASRYDLHTELRRTPVEDVLDTVAGMDVPRVVISGGEPLLWQDKPAWDYLLSGLAAMECRVEVETNGTIAPNLFTSAHVDNFNVSPKLAHSGDPEDRRIKHDVLRVFAGLALRGAATMKVVVETPADVGAAQALAAAVGFPQHAVWVMPQGTTPEALVGRTDLADAALAHGVNFTTRLHVLLWGEERGR